MTALVHVMAWRPMGVKPLNEQMMAPPGHSELIANMCAKAKLAL